MSLRACVSEPVILSGPDNLPEIEAADASVSEVEATTEEPEAETWRVLADAAAAAGKDAYAQEARRQLAAREAT